MNTFTQTNTIDWVNALGWMLLHSLWQALIVVLAVTFVLRLMPSLRSNVRYAIASAGLLLTTVINAVTFIDVAVKSANPRMDAPAQVTHHAVYFSGDATEPTSPFGFILSLIDQHMSLIVLLWATGFFVFGLRWAMGLYHSYRIKTGAQLIEGEWLEYVQRKAIALSIPRSVKLAQSTSISAPMMVGYLKPLILIPTGMIAGLSTQQLETIFLHELAHIRRNDYLMNLFQSIIESIFFFNPFVRMLSNEIRREREYCCDDIVVKVHGNTSAYAHALVRVAEARLTTPAFALSLTGNKNQLLARIKRIMEHSAKKSSVKNRLLLPLLLFAGALASISWISAERKGENQDVILSAADTVPDKDRNTARFSRKSIITIDENGQPHEEIIQQFEGDEELRALLERNMAMFNDSAFANEFHSDLFSGGMMMPLWNDTIPPFDNQALQEFADAFDARFREHFEHFFQGDSDLRKFMDEFENNFRWQEWAAPLEDLPLDSLGKLRDGDVFKNFREELEKFHEFAPEGMENLKENFRSPANPVQEYERALRERLIEDGYLSSEETIESLQWSEDSFKVNGKSLKPEDVQRYNDLRKGILDGDESKKQ